MMLQTLLIFQRKIVSAGNCPHSRCKMQFSTMFDNPFQCQVGRTEADPDAESL
jgi:hypothetical protein